MSPRTKEQYKAIRREKEALIIDSALELFAEKGYHTTSISHIAQKAGISKGLIYNYFDSKESLLVRILQDFISINTSLLNVGSRQEITGENMGKYIDAILDSLETRRNYWLVLTRFSMQKDIANLFFSHQSTRDTIAQLFHQVNNYFSKHFEHPHEEMLMFRSVIKGLALILLLTPGAYPPELIHSFRERLHRMFVR